MLPTTSPASSRSSPPATSIVVVIKSTLLKVQDRATGRVLHRGRCRGGLYPLISSRTSNKHAYGAIKISSSRWHDRLGHPSSSIVQRVLRDNKLSHHGEPNNEPVCDSCQRAKSHQLPYPVSTSVSTKPLELIFSDVWGDAPLSVGRYKYYVSFIDDYSKFSWIYLIKKKSDVFEVFQNFQAHVERQFNAKILAVQSDWGGEYEKLNSFFQKLGIARHVSCPYAHQQNGSAERKHCHIVEVGLALLANSFMPLKFWDEAFLAATYLINLLPSSAINFETPYERLFHKNPSYYSLRVFVCACWPNLRPYNNRKLSFRSKQCVFLGYSPRHKGVKCLDVSTGRIYISRDVVFDESVFPFASLHPNAGALLRNEILLLPDHLSPTHSFDHGDNNGNDQIMAVSRTTNPPSSDDAGFDDSYTGENLAQNSANMETHSPISHAALEDRGARSGADPGARSHADSGARSRAASPAPEAAHSTGGTQHQPVTSPGPAASSTRRMLSGEAASTRGMQPRISCEPVHTSTSRGSHRSVATSPGSAGSPAQPEQRIQRGPSVDLPATNPVLDTSGSDQDPLWLMDFLRKMMKLKIQRHHLLFEGVHGSNPALRSRLFRRMARLGMIFFSELNMARFAQQVSHKVFKKPWVIQDGEKQWTRNT